jgi:hypothetical protein
MTLRQIYTVKNNRLTIDLPVGMKNRKRVLVTVEDVVGGRDEKLLMMAEAAKDPLYLADLEEVNDDFKDIESDPE